MYPKATQVVSGGYRDSLDSGPTSYPPDPSLTCGWALQIELKPQASPGLCLVIPLKEGPWQEGPQRHCATTEVPGCPATPGSKMP